MLSRQLLKSKQLHQAPVNPLPVRFTFTLFLWSKSSPQSRADRIATSIEVVVVNPFETLSGNFEELRYVAAW